MRQCNRLVVLFLAGGALVGAAWAQPALVEALGATLGDGEQQQKQLGQRGADLTRRDGVILRRIMAKDLIVKDLLRGRATLLESARRFKDLNEKPADCQDDYRARFPGRTDGEKLCRQVIYWARAGLDEAPPSQAEAVLQRLEEELHDILCREGGLVALPEA